MIALLDGLIGLIGRGVLRLILAVFAGLLVGCSGVHKPWPDDPLVLHSPYTTPGGGELVWAVAPLRNESGVSVADELRISDRLVEQIRQSSGVTALPLNRTLETMRALGLSEIGSPADARSLAKRMGVDGVVVGTVTAWSPYEPPELGLTLALYAGAERGMEPAAAASGLMDPQSLVRAATGPVTTAAPEAPEHTGPLSEVSAHLSGADGAVRARVEAYGRGRADPNSATGWRGYLTTMSRFERFAGFEMVGRLFDQERRRLRREASAQTAGERTATPVASR